MSISKMPADMRICCQLARLFASNGSRTLLEQIISSNLVRFEAALNDNVCVGIWKRIGGGGAFRRDPFRSGEWGSWAQVDYIPEKTATKRIVLIGESVARAYLYDPIHSFADSLDGVLNRSSDSRRSYEVIDLAKLGMGFEFQELIAQSLKLSPDLIIVFSGNNWAHSLDEMLVKDLEASDIMGAHVSARRQILESALSEIISASTESVIAELDRRQIPVLWVIPEFNLADWRDLPQFMPPMSKSALAEWLGHHSSITADGCMNAGKIAQLTRMAELSSHASVRELYMLGVANTQCGLVNEAKAILIHAKDALLHRESISSMAPRPFSIIQNLLRNLPQRHRGVAVVDVPGLLDSRSNAGIPGKEQFLDYCHMTSTSLGVVASAVASKAINILDSEEILQEDLMKLFRPPNNEIEAEAEFSAAIHCSYFDQPREILQYRCERALQLDSRIADVMQMFVQLQAEKVPICLSSVGAKIVNSRYKLISHHLLQKHAVQVDATLCEVIQTCTGWLPNGRSSVRGLKKGALAAETIDLLDSYHLPYGRRNAVSNRPTYFRGEWLTSEFSFWADTSNSVMMMLLCLRTPLRGEVRLHLNGRLLHAAELQEHWSVWRVVVNREDILNGLNRLAIEWPNNVDAYKGSVVDDVLEKQTMTSLVFGEIQTLKICVQYSNEK